MGNQSPHRSYRIVALIVASAFFMEQLDSTIIATALPAMAESLGADPLRMNFAMTAYLLSLAACIPISGKVADRFGTRNTFRGAILLFTISSVLCGLAPNLTWLICARLLQGASGAMMVPVGRLILLKTVEKSQLVTAMSWVLFPAMLGPALGPLIGGVLTTYLSWHWIFYINVPIGIAGIMLVGTHIPDIREDASAPQGPFDYLGFILSGAALASLILGLESFSYEGMPRAVTTILLSVAALSALLYWAHSRKHVSPVLDFSLMRIITFRVAILAGLLYRIAYGGYPFLLPFMLQLGFGYSAAQSGAVTFIGAVGGLLMKAVSVRFLRAFGYRNVLIWNGVLSAGFLIACAAFRPDWPMLIIYLMLLIGGLSRSLHFNAFGTLTYADIPGSRMSAATSLASTNQQMTSALGIAVAAMALEVSMRALGHDSLQLSDFSVAFVFIGLIGMLAVPLCFRLPTDAGVELSGHRSQPAPVTTRQNSEP